MDGKRAAKGTEQVSKAWGNIDYLIRTTNEKLSTIKIKNDSKQKETRMEEEKRRNQRYDEI